MVTNGKLVDIADAKGAVGVYYDQARKGFVVLTPATGTGSDLTAGDFRRVSDTVRVKKSTVSRATLDAVGTMLRGRAFHPQAEKYGYGWYHNLVEDRLVVETSATREVMAPVVRRFGSRIELKYGAAQRDTRRNDPPPHWGGASITAGGATCSSGFGVQNGSGTRFMATAGHCWGQGTAVSSPEGGWSWGTVVNRAPFPTYDLELLGGNSYGSHIYRGGASGDAVQLVGAADPVVGFAGYCRSGQTTFQQCGQRVTSLDAEFCDASGCTPVVISYDSGGLSAGGDSGSPFYVDSVGGTTIHARGIHFGRIGSTMYAERWSSLSGYFGVSIVTG